MQAVWQWISSRYRTLGLIGVLAAALVAWQVYLGSSSPIAPVVASFPFKFGDNPSPPGPPPPPPAPAPTPSEFSVLLLPQANKVAGIELPADQSVPATSKYIPIVVKTDSPTQQLEWLVFGSVPNYPPTALVSASGRSVLVFPGSAQADLIVVMCYSSVNGSPTNTAVTKITVEAAASNDPPAPPAKSPVTGTLHITTVVDLATQTPAIAAMRTSKAFKDAVASLDCKLYDVTPTTAPEDMRGPLAAAGGAPAVIVQDSQYRIIARERFSNSEDILNLINNLRSGK